MQDFLSSDAFDEAEYEKAMQEAFNEDYYQVRSQWHPCITIGRSYEQRIETCLHDGHVWQSARLSGKLAVRVFALCLSLQAKPASTRPSQRRLKMWPHCK